MGSLLAGSPVPLSDWEHWAYSNTVLEAHGDQAPVHVAEQICALVLKSDDEGIRTYRRSRDVSSN